MSNQVQSNQIQTLELLFRHAVLAVIAKTDSIHTRVAGTQLVKNKTGSAVQVILNGRKEGAL